MDANFGNMWSGNAATKAVDTGASSVTEASVGGFKWRMPHVPGWVGPVGIIVGIIVIIVLLIALFGFVGDVINGKDLAYWLPFFLVLLFFVDLRLFLFAGILLIIFYCYRGSADWTRDGSPKQSEHDVSGPR